MPLGLLGAVQNYPQMLRKISTFSFLFACIAIYILSSQIPSLGSFLKNYKYSINVLNMSLPFGIFIPAFLFALVSRIIKLHNKLSDVFSLRVRFDTSHILLPMAKASGTTNANIDLKKITEKRKKLMKEVFYKYASSTPNMSVIDTHYVIMAMDQWSWFWIVQEGVFIFIITSLILLFVGKLMTTFILTAVVAIGLLLLLYIWVGCRKYAEQEIEQILDNPLRMKAIAGVFNAL
jgi:hypothetical protein